MNTRTKHFLIAFFAAALVSATIFFLIGYGILPDKKTSVSLSDALSILFASDRSPTLLPSKENTEGQKRDGFCILLTGLDYRPDDFYDYRDSLSSVTVTKPGVLGENNRRIEADFIALVYVDPLARSFSVISLPENMLLTAGGEERLLKTVYADFGEEYFVSLISAATGMEIDHRVFVNVSDIGSVVEAAGNVTVSVPCDMYLENELYTASPKSGDATLLLSKGEQYITKNNAVWLLSFNDYRNGGSRAETILSFAHGLMARFCQIETLLRIDEVYATVSKSVSTDVTADDLHEHINVLLSFTSYDVSTRTYPGSYSADSSVFYPDREAALPLLSEFR